MNNIYHSDCLDLLQGESAPRDIDLIYIDPPYASESDYLLPDGSVAFTDRWREGIQGYLDFLEPRLRAMHDALSDTGSIFVHVDYHASAYVRLMLDRIFGSDCLRNEIIWCYRQGGRSTREFGRKHDTIYWYSKNPELWTFNADDVRIPYHGTGGYQRSGRGVKINGTVYKPHEGGKIPEDWWDIPAIPPMSGERTGYPTQKPLQLLKRIILAASNPGDLVADFFAGSGTTVVAAHQLGRRYIACDISAEAVRTIRARLSNEKTG